MSYHVTARFAPGEVTPEQLEELRKAYEAAKQKEKVTLRQYEAAYGVYSDALFERRKAENIYEWAKHGMVSQAVQP